MKELGGYRRTAAELLQMTWKAFISISFFLSSLLLLLLLVQLCEYSVCTVCVVVCVYMCGPTACRNLCVYVCTNSFLLQPFSSISHYLEL